MNDKNLHADIESRGLVFVTPGENIVNALHVFCPYDSNDSLWAEKHLNFLRRHFKNLPEGNVAVFVYDRDTESYYYYKTIKHRRKSFALLSDSE